MIRLDEIKNHAGGLDKIKVILLRNVKNEDLINRCKQFDKKDEYYNEILGQMSLGDSKL